MIVHTCSYVPLYMCQAIVCHCVFLPLESPHPPGPPVDRSQGSGENVSVYMECGHPSTFELTSKELFVIDFHITAAFNLPIDIPTAHTCMHAHITDVDKPHLI